MSSTIARAGASTVVSVFSDVPGLAASVRRLIAGEAESSSCSGLLGNVEVVDIALPDSSGGDGASSSPPPDTVAALADARLLLSDPGRCAPYIRGGELPKLEWLQSTWAGVEPLVAKEHLAATTTEYRCSRAVGIFGPQMAQYVLGWILAIERNILVGDELQRRKVWDQRATVIQRPLRAVSVGVMGASGDIGSNVIKTIKMMGMPTVGLISPRRQAIILEEEEKKQQPHQRQEEACVAAGGDGGDTTGKHEGRADFETADLAEFLSRCDYVVNILPHTPATRGMLGGTAFEACAGRRVVADADEGSNKGAPVPNQSGAVFINVGRGSIIEEPDLLRALEEGWLRAAVLDVFCVEPLPEDSPLWKHPAVHITPHVAAASTKDDVGEIFVQNLKLFLDGKPLKGEVDFAVGY